jgi:cytochrome c-type biogenesis protein CcmF
LRIEHRLKEALNFMEGIEYIGEHLWPGQIGQAAVMLAFVTALLSAIAYFYGTKRRDTPEAKSWMQLGRGAYIVHGASIFLVIGTMFYIMINQYYEYQYVQAHVSEDLPMKYIFSAFWEGQEGSFLLWMFWHIVLGLILIGTAKKWEAPVMATIAAVQVFITSMILGIYLGFGDEPFRLGSNPLLLLRDTVDAPIFAKANYVELIKGTGLNPLLQNYWMTIHPPTLFLGFASTVVPFGFAIGGLWTGDHKGWLKPALPWALFSGAILGTGILMGGAWAYEALSFGGYWAWDPVENMSLVPWLILIAGIHTNLIAKNTNYSIRSTYIYYTLTFVLIVYSTFLTRSGVLGDTSVHAFTEMGLEWQLVSFIAAFTLLGFGLLAWQYKRIPSPKKEEHVASREFWMFIGTLVLLFSSLIITGSTSLPVYNKIMQFFDPAFEGRVITEPIQHYNKYQIWIAVFISILSGSAQWLRYKAVNWSKYFRKFSLHMGIAAVGAVALTYLTSLWIDMKSWQYGVLLFTGLFAVVANIDYIFTFVKGNVKAAGSAVAHLGFGLMIVGIIASGLNKRFISSNPFVMDGLIEGADEESLKNNILLFKNTPMIMGDYEVTYTSDTLDVFTRTYTVNYKRRNADGEVTEEFNLYPNVLYEKTFKKIAASNPSTKRYLNRDVFTHIASLPVVEMDMEFRKAREDSLNYRRIDLPEGQWQTFVDTVPIVDKDTFILRNYQVRFQGLNQQPQHPDYKPAENDIPLGAEIQISRDDADSIYTVRPMLNLQGQLMYNYPVQINELSSKVRLLPEAYDQIFTSEERLDYKEISLKQGERTTVGGLDVLFERFSRTPENQAYQAQEGDVAVSAILQVSDQKETAIIAEPVYVIRGNKPMNFKTAVNDLGFHARFVGIDPTTETVTLLVAQQDKAPSSIPLELATNSQRSDYIVLEAIEFPGINFFWIGSIFMMLGLTLSTYHRIRQK